MYNIKELVALLGATYEGNIEEIAGLAPFEFANENDLTFAADEKYLKKIMETNAKVIVVPPVPNLPKEKNYIVVNKSPRELMPILLNYFKKVTKPFEKSIEDSAIIGLGTILAPNIYIGHNVKIGENCIIHPNVTVLEGVEIGANSIIYSGVNIREFCKIGDNVIIQPGAVIGSDGFGYIKINGKNVKIEQIGSVLIENDVEIGANTTIDRGTIGDTVIKRGTKLDNLIHIAHNVRVGEQGFMAAQVGIAGSTTIGDNITIGGQAGITGHISIGNNVVIAAKAGVTNNISDNEAVAGFPAINHVDDLKSKIALKKLPEFLKRVRKIEGLIDKGE